MGYYAAFSRNPNREKRMKRCMMMAFALMLGLPVMAAEGVALEDQSSAKFDFGGDLRLRYDFTNNLPDDGHGEKGHTDYARVRTRLWGKMTVQKLELFARVANEFRYYNSRESDKGKQRFPDVTFIDNLYLKYSDLFDFIDVKVGRQEMAFGSKRIISDGTGGDGSRSNYFDAVRLTFDFGNKRTLDAFAIYMDHEDWLPTLGHTHDAKSKHNKSYGYETSGYDQDEYGAGLYYQDRSNDEFGWDAYYVFKVEEAAHEYDHGSFISDWNSLQGNNDDSFMTHTFGVRLMPKFTKNLSGEAELAVQFGDDSHLAMMAYGGLTYSRKDWAWQPKFTAAVQYMSGDEDGWAGDNAWHPVFNRETGVGETVAPMFPKYAYNNFLYPHIKLDLVPAENQKLSFQTGPMFAPTTEKASATEDYGTFRGYYAQVKYSIAIGKMIDSPWLKGLGMAFQGEYMSKGDYFNDGEDDDALFGRMELTYKF